MSLNKSKLAAIHFSGFSVQELEQAQRNLYSIVLALERKDYREAAMIAECLQGQAADIMARCDRFAKKA